MLFHSLMTAELKLAKMEQKTSSCVAIADIQLNQQRLFVTYKQTKDLLTSTEEVKLYKRNTLYKATQKDLRSLEGDKNILDTIVNFFEELTDF